MYCKFCGNRLAGGSKKCTACKADIDYNDCGQTFYGDEEFIEWQVDENQKPGRVTNMPVTKNLSSMETVKVNLPTKNKKKKGALFSSKNLLVFSIVAVIIIIVLSIAIFVASKSKGEDSKDEKKYTDDMIAENEFPQIQAETSRHAEAKDKEVSAMAIPAEISEDGKLNLNASATGSHVAVVTAEDGTVTYYIPLRSYLTDEEDFDVWGIINNETGELGANRRSSYDTGVVYISIRPVTPIVITTENIANSEPIQHNYHGKIYTSHDGNECYVPVSALAELLGYGEVVYDSANSVIKFTAKVAQVVNPENQDEPVGEKIPEKPAVNDDELTEAQKKAIKEEEERIKAAEATEKQAQEQAKKEAEAQSKAEGGAGNHVHSYDDQWITITSATCTEDGKQMRECKTCQSGRETQDIPAIGHTYGDSVITKQVSCSETGIKEQTCTACGNKKTETIPTTEHSYSGWSSTKKATCTSNGEETRTCSQCNKKETRTVSASEHDYAYITETQANCKDKGTEIGSCKNCGKTNTRDIPVTDNHSFENGICKNCGKVET